jgi:hypothetical protein
VAIEIFPSKLHESQIFVADAHVKFPVGKKWAYPRGLTLMVLCPFDAYKYGQNWSKVDSNISKKNF